MDANDNLPSDDERELIRALMTPAERAAHPNFDLSKLTPVKQRDLKILLLLRHLEAAGVHVSPGGKLIETESVLIKVLAGLRG